MHITLRFECRSGPEHRRAVHELRGQRRQDELLPQVARAVRERPRRRGDAIARRVEPGEQRGHLARHPLDAADLAPDGGAAVDHDRRAQRRPPRGAEGRELAPLALRVAAGERLQRDPVGEGDGLDAVVDPGAQRAAPRGRSRPAAGCASSSNGSPPNARLVECALRWRTRACGQNQVSIPASVARRPRSRSSA